MNKDEQVSRNLELAGWFFEHLLEHPSQLESQPDSQYLILIPEDDEELADANLKTARALIHKCPHCGSPRVVMDNAFGPTQCRALFYCRDCRQPFEAMKRV